MTVLEPLALPDSDGIRAWIGDRAGAELGRARAIAERLRTAPPADALEVLQAWNELHTALGNVSGPASLLASVHPDAATREACEGHIVEVQRLSTSLHQDPLVFAAFAGHSGEGLDALAARFLDKTLTDFRRAGVDQPADVRERLAALQEEMTSLDLEFSAVLRDDVRSITVSPSRLDGLPADWIAAHPLDDEGLVTITTDYPDLFPVRTFATDRSLRREMVATAFNKGFPATEPILSRLFAARHELATLLGYADWPSYDAEVKMIGSGPGRDSSAGAVASGDQPRSRGHRIPDFIDRISAASEEPMRRDVAVLLERLRRDEPSATELTGYDTAFYSEAIRRERFDVDAQEVRRYFDFGKVRAGLLQVTAELFGLDYAPVEMPTWHADVTAYDVRDQAGAVLGRIYLDLHPREGKYKHAAQFTLVDGVAGVQQPEGVLVCNFPRGLMEHHDVVTLFHEFGHLLHHLIGGHSPWGRFSGVATEWDFVEAPSQMLEEWAWDASVLATFATDIDGEVIPAALVEKMRAGEEFGKGIQARQQMFYAALSYWFHASRPADLTETMVELQSRYAPTPWIEGTHFFADFGHLGGYSSAYYTYMWSLVIAKDLFSEFNPEDLFDHEVAFRYRELILARGGEKDAADLVADFLGRPFSFDAYADWLAR